MADTAASLVIALSADIASFRKEMKAATGVFDKEGREIERRNRALQKELARTGASADLLGGAFRRLAPFLTAGALISYARSVMSMADALQDTSDQLGITTQDLQALDATARATGAGAEGMRRALGTLTQGLGEAEKGEGQLAKMMRQLGISMGTPMQVFFDLADATQKATTQAARMEIATTAFGKAGKALVPILQDGAAGLRAQFEEAQRSGQIWDPETIKSLDNAGDAFERLKVILAGKFANPFADILNSIMGIPPSIEKLKRDLPIAQRYADARRGSQVGVQAQLKINDWQDLINADIQKNARAERIPFARSATGRAAVPASAADTTKAIAEAKAIEKAYRDAEEAISDALSKVIGEGFKQASADRGIFTSIAGSKAQQAGAVLDAKATIGQIAEDTAAFHAEAEARWNDYYQRLAEDQQAFADRWGETLADNLINLGAAATQGGDTFAKAMANMIASVGMLIVKMELARAISGALSPGSFLGSLFGPSAASAGSFIGGESIFPGRAAGGPVSAGHGYKVGERGPELFVPNVPGAIVPNHKLGGGSISIHVDARGAQEGVADQLASVLPAAIAQAVKASRSEFARNFDLVMRDRR